MCKGRTLVRKAKQKRVLEMKKHRENGEANKKLVAEMLDINLLPIDPKDIPELNEDGIMIYNPNNERMRRWIEDD